MNCYFVDNMYISLVLLWLSFKIIQGEIIQCQIGGLTIKQQCEKLNEESVMQRFFINEENIYMHQLFGNSLILNETIPIKERWDEALKIGTDTYRIKFHTKLVNQYKHNYKSLPNEECMVLIQSFYVAASTYYFSKKCELAYNVINDGLEFFEIVKEQLYFGNNDETQDNQGKHARVWSILLQTLKVDILICLNKYHYQEEQSEVIKKISEEEKQFDFPNYGSFPSSAVLLFRGYFLDKGIDGNTKTKLKNWLSKRTLWEHFNDDILDRDYISLYKFLIFFYNSPKDMDKLINIFKAIEKPVLSTEDRLLNYKATELALGVVSSCFDGNKSPICIEFSNFQNSHPRVESTIIPKLRILYDLENTNLIKELKTELSINNHIIQQNVLHLIKTAALDIDSEKYQKNIKNVKLAIELLNDYAKGQENVLNIINKDKQENIKTDDETTTKTIDKEEFKEKEPIDEHDKVSTVKYSENEIIENLFIVYKWLTELNGVLSNNLEAKTYQKNLLEALENATNLTRNDLLGTTFISDEHYKYLVLKRKSKEILPFDNWEVSTRIDGWVLSVSEKDKLGINYVFTFDEDKYNIYLELLRLETNLRCPYINRIDINTLIFRYWNSAKYFELMYIFIMNTITKIVITPEDRLRNLEVHELFTMFLMERNKLEIISKDMGYQDASSDQSDD